jgi:hypothetical protein
MDSERCMQLYRPLEFLLAVSAFATIAENLLPPLIAFEKEAVRQVVRNLLSLTYVIAFTQVLFNIKKRIVKERLWKAEAEGPSYCMLSYIVFMPASITKWE